MKKRPNPATAHTQSRQSGAQTTSHSSALVRGRSTWFIANPCCWPQRPCPKRGYISASFPPFLHIHTHTHTYIHGYRYMYIRIHIYMDTYTCTYAYIRTYTYIYIYVDMYIYIYIYIYIYRIFTSCIECEANVYADVHNICRTYTSAHAWCSTTPVNACRLSAKMHMDSCTCTYTCRVRQPRQCEPIGDECSWLAPSLIDAA